MKRLMPNTVSGQLIAAAMFALAISQIGILVITAQERRDAAQEWWSGYVLARIASVVELLDRTPDTIHDQIINASDIEDLTFEIVSDPPEDTTTEPQALSPKIELLALMPRQPDQIVVEITEMSWIELFGRIIEEVSGAQSTETESWLDAMILLKNRKWLHVEANPRLNLPSFAVLFVPVVTMLIVFGSTILILIRHINTPIQTLASAAEAFGRGEAGAPIDPAGPAEIREAIRAFNAMRERLSRFVLDRTKMLAAVGHDLRTPITTMRLRAEFIEEDETRQKILESLDEMQHMAEAALTFAREEAITESTKTVDLNALVQTVCSDQSDINRDVTYCEAERMPYRCRPNSLKRAVRNLVENAVVHGKRARVTLNGPGKEAWITVEDDGPGIPPSNMQQVFMPFVKIDDARGEETGGIGLGLAIARSIVRGHGGDIQMENRREGGLKATIRLPIPS